MLKHLTWCPTVSRTSVPRYHCREHRKHSSRLGSHLKIFLSHSVVISESQVSSDLRGAALYPKGMNLGGWFIGGPWKLATIVRSRDSEAAIIEEHMRSSSD